MKNKIARRLLLTFSFVLLAVGSTMAMMVVMSKVSKQVKVMGIEEVELKGFSSIQIVVDIDNGSNYDLEMIDASADIMLEGDKVGTLKQANRIVAKANSRELVKSLWRLENVDPMTLLMLSGKVLASDYSALTMNYQSVVKAGRYTHNFVDEDVDISKFLTIFQPENEN